jgi:hypothetical protein
VGEAAIFLLQVENDAMRLQQTRQEDREGEKRRCKEGGGVKEGGSGCKERGDAMKRRYRGQGAEKRHDSRSSGR